MVFDEKDINRAILSRRLHGGNIDRKPRRALPPAFAYLQKVKGASFRVHFTVQRFGMVVRGRGYSITHGCSAPVSVGGAFI